MEPEVSLTVSFQLLGFFALSRLQASQLNPCLCNTSEFFSQGFLHLGLPVGTDSTMVAYIRPAKGIVSDILFYIVSHARAGTLGATPKIRS